MSAFDKTRAAIQSMFKSGFVSSGTTPLFPVQYENHAFSKPEGATWCRFTIRDGQRTNAAVGNDLKRTPGIIFLQVFIPENKGTKDANTAAAKVAEIFDDQTHSDTWGAIQFFSASKQNIGKGSDGFFQANITVEYRVDEIN